MFRSPISRKIRDEWDYYEHCEIHEIAELVVSALAPLQGLSHCTPFLLWATTQRFGRGAKESLQQVCESIGLLATAGAEAEARIQACWLCV